MSNLTFTRGAKTGESLFDGSDTGAEIFLPHLVVAGVFVPPGMAGTTLTFEVRPDGGVWYPLKNESGGDISITIDSDGGYYAFTNTLVMGGNFRIRPISSASETAKTVVLVGQAVA